jgi:hypothetical protein
MISNELHNQLLARDNHAQDTKVLVKLIAEGGSDKLPVSVR